MDELVEGTVDETTISSNTSPKLAKVMELARKDPGLRLRSLAHVLDEHLPSGDRSKPASCGRVKTGQLLQDRVPVTRDRSVLQVSS